MYQNIWCEKRGGNQVEVHLWDDVAGYQNFVFKNYAYIKDGSGQYRSIYGDKLKKVTYWTEEDFKTGRVFESDIPLDTRILLDRYLDSDEPSKDHRELFFDIEVEVTDGFPEPTKANNKITSIEIVVIAIVRDVLIYGKEFVKTKYVIIDATKDKIINKIVIFLFVDGFLNQRGIIVINFKKKVESKE